jgi:dihydroorotase
MEDYDSALSAPHIDPHVHCRDYNQAYKATIKSTMALARSQGVVAVCDMPNTDPPIISREEAERRIWLAREEGVEEGYYIYMGLTSDPRQIAEAVDVSNSNPRVVGMKLYAGTSTGNLAVVGKEQQRTVYNELARLGYEGILAVHCEKEDMFDMHAWNPQHPSTWNSARPPVAEVESVRDQIEMAATSGFKGTLHIPHISTPESVEVVFAAKKNMKVTSGATPHHLALSTQDMEGKDGILLKVNPPLRDMARASRLRELLKAGMIDWIETDHAPHTELDKRERYMSGIRSLDNYLNFLKGLLQDGFSADQIRALTYGNIKRTYTKITE